MSKHQMDLPLASDLLDRAFGGDTPEGLTDFVVQGLTCDSRQVRTGYIFVAVPGKIVDGAKFACDAAAKGAQLVITHRQIENLPCPQMLVADPRQVAAELAAAFYQLDKLLTGPVKLVGVTGTNGKTTVTYIIQHLCTNLGFPCARLGTVEYDLIGEKVNASHTTPEPVELCRLVRTAIDHGARTIAAEVSSHALSQARAGGLRFATGVFTNLSGDHLDYHGTMREYLDAKLVLFRSLDRSASAVVNIDDPSGSQVIASTIGTTVTYGIRRADADLYAHDIELAGRGTTFTVTFENKTARIVAPYIGKHNVYNILAGLGAAISVGLDFDLAAKAIASLPAVPGRLERIDHRGDFEVFVDYAHTDDGLENVLTALRPLTHRLVTVFGCGGDRDRTKRPRMATVAEQWSDRVVVTSDNPRTEDPKAIIDDVLKGFSEKGKSSVTVEIDRAKAIGSALAEAKRGDIVLIAGKGHETYQLIGDQRLEFDDRQEVRRALASLGLQDQQRSRNL
jgi:UDP-N-acetylmuramoyl-L-alanyl-D-glutamate--2,6-diaminopimelate ligase